MQREANIARTWIEERRDAALLRVTDAAGLGPRATDELLLIDARGESAGSLLGGAADPELRAAAVDLIANGDAVRTVALDIADANAESAGLACGGFVKVLIQPLDRVPASLWDALATGRPAALATAVQGANGSVVHRPGQPADGTFGSPELDQATETAARTLLARPGHHVEHIRTPESEIVVEAWHPVPHVLSVGASALSDALGPQAALLGWSSSTVTTLDDALTAVADLTATDVVIVIDHDHDVATPVLAKGLRNGVGYVGALGSRHTQQARREHLHAAGLDDAALAQLHAPTGLDLGARTPAETAVSIVAEIIAMRAGRSAAPLRGTEGRIGS